MPDRWSRARCYASTSGKQTGKARPTSSRCTSIVCAASCNGPASIPRSRPCGDGAMSFERLKDVFRTLRFRLMAWNTGVVLLMVLPTLFLVREGFRRLVHVEFDRILAEDINEIKLSIKQLYPNLPELYKELKRRAQGHAHH